MISWAGFYRNFIRDYTATTIASMADKMTEQQRHECMSHIRSRDTNPEVIVRRELFRRGFRFRKNVRTLPGTPDIVLPRYHTVVFINGCFWHGHKGCRLYTIPKTNVRFWTDKIERNRNRDLLNVQRLESIAWNVITIWECQLDKAAISATMQALESEIRSNESRWEEYRNRRRKDRQFALEQARKRREITALVEAEINEQFHIPARIRRMSKDYDIF